MGDPQTSRSERAVAAAVAVAAAHGLACDDPAVLHDGSNVLVELRPAPVIARVSTKTGEARPGTAWLRRELQIARHLAGAGAPAVRPSGLLAPGPHEHDGLALSFWETIPDAQPVGDPAAAGAALRACHDALRGFPEPLPRLGALAEARSLVAEHAKAGRLAISQFELLEPIGESLTETLGAASARFRPVHGDAHLRNVLQAGPDPVWIDWEDCCSAPVEWDLACLVKTARVQADTVDPGPAEAALEHWGSDFDPDLLDRCVEARAFQVVAWSLQFGRKADDPQVAAHLDWLLPGDGG
jgi:Phosphotransferase enzyme family